MKTLLFATILLAASSARATTGGPRSIEVLGHEPDTGLIWYLEHDGSESAEPPRLFRLPTRGARPRMAAEERWLTPARDAAWHARGIDQPFFIDLRTRLEPLVRMPPSEAVVQVQCDRAGNARGRLTGPQLVGRPVSLKIVRGCEATVHALFLVPGGPLALAVVRYVGVDVESGYDLDRALLVRYREPSGHPVRVRRGDAPLRPRIEAVIDEQTGELARLDLAVVDPAGDTHAALVAWQPRACNPTGPTEIACAEGAFELTRRGRIVEVTRDGAPIARAHVPRGRSTEPLAFAFAREVEWGDDARVACAHDWDCRIAIGKHTVAFEPMRGSFECHRDGSVLECVYTHTTNLYYRRLWRIELDTGRARARTLPSAALQP